MFRLPSIIKTPSYRRFEFKTRYYNAEKEAFDERVRLASKEAGADLTESEAIKARVQKQYEKRRSTTKIYGARQSNIRILLITGVLGALIYWILK